MSLCLKHECFLLSQRKASLVPFLFPLTVLKLAHGSMLNNKNDSGLHSPSFMQNIEFYNTSVSARWRVPYAVEENLRGMTE